MNEPDQIQYVEEFFKKTFLADKATFVPVDDDMKKRIDIKSIVKIETYDRGNFYISMLNEEDFEK